jgi:hypothetical protein
MWKRAALLKRSSMTASRTIFEWRVWFSPFSTMNDPRERDGPAACFTAGRYGKGPTS